MIDVENEVLTIIYNAVHPVYESAKFESYLNLSPAAFPCVCVEEINNTTYTQTSDSSAVENHALVVYEVNIFTNLTSGKKAQARNIAKLIDDALGRKNFERTMTNPVTINNGTVYRLVMRYSVVASNTNTFFGR